MKCSFFAKLREDLRNYSRENRSETVTLASHYLSCYRGVPVVRTGGKRSGSFGLLFLTRHADADTLRHEYGHYLQLRQLGIVAYARRIFLPSWRNSDPDGYYERPWEITADLLGEVTSRTHSPEAVEAGFAYLHRSKHHRRKETEL